ncbi:MAG TPA: hypothetical protein VFQ92_06350, partial [Blastocatellia bacterium]|nr:hypothetical protein [Blastocatellia bacterium]
MVRLRNIAFRPRRIRTALLKSIALLLLISLMAGAGAAGRGEAAESSASNSISSPVDNCLSAQVINPAALPFSEDSTTEGA